MDQNLDSVLASQLTLFGSVPLQVEVELHRTAVTVREILNWKEGSLITLGKRRDAALNIRIGGTVVAKGELASGSSKQAVRVTSFSMKEQV